MRCKVCFCKNCGVEIGDNAFCPNCGTPVSHAPVDNPVYQQAPQQPVYQQAPVNINIGANPTVSNKDWLTTLLLCLFFGGLGVHRFYSGKTGTGVLWLLTFGCLGIGSLVDFIMICCGTFTDGQGIQIKHNK